MIRGIFVGPALATVGCRRGEPAIGADDAGSRAVVDGARADAGSSVDLQLAVFDAADEVVARYDVSVPIGTCIPIRTPDGKWVQVQPDWASNVFRVAGDPGAKTRVFEVHVYRDAGAGFRWVQGIAQPIGSHIEASSGFSMAIHWDPAAIPDERVTDEESIVKRQGPRHPCPEPAPDAVPTPKVQKSRSSGRG